MSFFTLKTIALLSMLWDHLTYVWPLTMTLELLFFPDALGGRSAEQRGEIVRETLVNAK